MAEVTARKRGSKWEYRFEMAMSGGKRRQYSKGGFATKKEAMKEGTEAFSRYNRAGTVFEPHDMSFSDYLDFWLANYCRKQLKPMTCDGYISATESVIRPFFGTYRLMAIRPDNIMEWLDHLVAHGYRSTTIKYFKSVLSCAFRYAVTPLRYLEYNPVSNIRLPKMKREKDDRKLLSPQDFTELLDLFDDGKRGEMTAFHLGFYCGLRAGEAVGLTWDDIDLDRSIIHVHRQFIHDRLSTLKTASSERDIPIGETLAEYLKKEHEAQQTDRKDYAEFYTCYRLEDDAVVPCQPGNQESLDFVCRKENGIRIRQMTLNLFCNRLSQKAGYHFTFHMLRHSHATILAIGNTPVKAIQERLGHSSAAMTMNVYMHNTPEQSRLASDIFESLVHVEKKAWTNRGQNGRFELSSESGDFDNSLQYNKLKGYEKHFKSV